jgi:hypothetical protein
MSDPQPTPIVDQLNTLGSIDSSYDRRQAIDDLDQGVTYSVSVVIDKIAKNYGYVREDGYRDAYYITGAISDSEHRVKVLLPTEMNSEVESWNEGETRVVEAIISDWDLAYKQFGLLGRRSIVAETKADTVADQTDALTSSSENNENAAEPVEPVEEPVIVAEVEADNQEPEAVESMEDPVAVTEVEADNEEPKPIEPAETNQAAEEVIDLESKVAQPEDPDAATPVNQEIEDFVEQMEAPTPLEQLADEYADAQPNDSEEEISIQTAIPLLDDVPILKDVPTREAASTTPQAKQFSGHTPVRPTRIPSAVKKDEAPDQTKMIIKIIVGLCVGIIVLMCLCCGILSQTGG